MLSQHESEILNDLDQRLSFLSGSALPSALRVANFQNKKDSIKESLWDQGTKMAAKNLNISQLKTNTSTRKSTITLVTLQSFSTSGEISAEKMYVEN